MRGCLFGILDELRILLATTVVILLSVKACGNSFSRLADLAPNLHHLRLYPPSSEAPCVPISQLPVLLKFFRLRSAYIYFKGQVGGGHRSPHYIEHFMRGTFFDVLPAAFPMLEAVGDSCLKPGVGASVRKNVVGHERSHIELTMRPVGATIENVLTLVIYRSSMGDVLHYWE